MTILGKAKTPPPKCPNNTERKFSFDIKTGESKSWCEPLPQKPNCPEGQHARLYKDGLSDSKWLCVNDVPNYRKSIYYKSGDYSENLAIAILVLLALILPLIWRPKMEKRILHILIVMGAGGIAAFFFAFAFERYDHHIDRPIMFGIGVFLALGAWFAYREFFVGGEAEKPRRNALNENVTKDQ